MALDLETLAKAAGGTGVIGVVVLWLNHQFASGESRLADRRKRTEDAQAVLTKQVESLQTEVKEKEDKIEHDREVRHAQGNRLQAIIWHADMLREDLLELCGFGRRDEKPPTYLLDRAEKQKTAKEIIEAIPLPDAKKTEENHG